MTSGMASPPDRADQLAKRLKFSILFCVVVYAVGVLAYVAWSNRRARMEILADIDQRLLIAAESLKYMLAPDFHDRAVDASSISFEEEMVNREAITHYALETDFQWLYTLIEKDGNFYFAAPTVTAEEARDQKRWYFHPYADIPAAFVTAYRENRPVTLSYQDQWGSFRSIALPQQSQGGRRYLACADFDIGFIGALLVKKRRESMLTALIFFGLIVPFGLILIRYSGALAEANKRLHAHRNELESRVNERTTELKSAKDRAEALVGDLEQAMDKVKQLRGMLPICSNCKNIRDDQGYWNRIETYLRDHSEAEFSHSICPDCARKLYPEFYEGPKKSPRKR